MKDETTRHEPSRRVVLAGGLGALVGAGATMLPRLGVAAPARLLKITGGGVAGGGVARGSAGDATFSVLATRLQPEGGQPVILGRILWVDPAVAGGVTLESVEITEYGPIPGIANGRRAKGTMRVNGEGQHPFSLDMLDNGPPGAGTDTISLAVGSDTGPFSYTSVATVASGDLELLTFDFSV